MTSLEGEVRHRIRDVADFPKAGVLFKDITPLLMDPTLMGQVMDWMAEDCESVDRIVAIESRGFLFSTGLSERTGKPTAPARKAGKLPWKTVGTEYQLEYGTAKLELHVDALHPGDRVLIVDDLLATGGTAEAAVDLVRQLGGTVLGCTFLIELGFLPGRERLAALGVPVRSLVTY